MLILRAIMLMADKLTLLPEFHSCLLTMVSPCLAGFYFLSLDAGLVIFSCCPDAALSRRLLVQPFGILYGDLLWWLCHGADSYTQVAS